MAAGLTKRFMSIEDIVRLTDQFNMKNKIISNTVKYLQNKYGANFVLINDFWEDDNNAIGIVDETKKFLAYFAIYENNSDKIFYVSLEELTLSDNFPYKSVGDFHKIDLLQLEIVISQHLKLK